MVYYVLKIVPQTRERRGEEKKKKVKLEKIRDAMSYSNSWHFRIRQSLIGTHWTLEWYLICIHTREYGAHVCEY